MADEYKSIYSGQEVDNAVATAQKALTTDNLVQTTGPSPNNVMSQAATTAAIQNIKAGTTVTVNNVAQTTWNADTKINIFQGTENAGKTFMVGQDGNAVLQTSQTGGTTIQIDGVPQSTINFTSDPQTQLNELGNTVNEISDEISNKQDKIIINNYTIQSAAWTSLSEQAPYTYSATITSTPTLDTNSIVELVNNQAVLFATYGFAIGSISGQNITIYSIGQPSTSVTLTVGVTG